MRHHFKLGKFECVILQDLEHTEKAEGFFINVPVEELYPIVREHGMEPDAVPISYNVLAINTGGEWVMLDSGHGGLIGKETCLWAELDNAGISRESISKIFISHAHADHYGGLRDRLNEQHPVFPNAHYYMHRIEWQHWTSPEKLAEVGENMTQIIKRWVMKLEPDLTLIEDGDSIVPGLTAVHLPGHTPGHTGMMIESEGERLLYIGDAAIHPLHLKYPGWHFYNDGDHTQATATKEKIIAMGVPVFAFHFPFPGLWG